MGDDLIRFGVACDERGGASAIEVEDGDRTKRFHPERALCKRCAVGVRGLSSVNDGKDDAAVLFDANERAGVNVGVRCGIWAITSQMNLPWSFTISS